MSETAALTFEGVTAGYGKMTVLHELTFSLSSNEVLAVLGANGSGKSTVLKTAIGLTQVSGGAIRLHEQEVTALSPDRRAALGIGYVPQTRNVFPDLSVLDNLRMGAFLHPDAFESGLDRVHDLFPRLRDRQHTRARDLSGGERRMLSIALTLLLRPRLLLLDEPSSDLAPATVTLVFDAIRRIRAEMGTPLLLVEQNVQAAMSIADRVIVLVRGRCALDVPAAELDKSQLHSLFMDSGARTG